MKIEIFTSRTGDKVMVDTNAERAFGPVFGSDEDPMEFAEWLKESCGYKDVCDCGFLKKYVAEWRQEVENANEGGDNIDYDATTLDEQCDKARKLK